MNTVLLDNNSILTQNTSEEQRQLYRKHCRDSLYFLCKGVLGFKDMTTVVHKPACEFLQHVARRRKLMLPRGFLKSHTATIGYPIWLTIQEANPALGFRGTDERILIGNAVSTNSEHFLSKIKKVYERNAMLQWLFPEIIPDFSSSNLQWNVTESTLPRKTDYPEPTFSAVGVGAAVVSRHFTRIILDDLIDEKVAL